MGASYDRVRYTGLPLDQTHPDRLATVGTILGMPVAAPERCRVLELGAGDGGNLIPMALGLPESSFLGIDLASQAVECGCEIIRALDLKNISLRVLDLMDAGPDLGEFDYIIAHGVYSWVPDAVRERLLHVCCANLAPHGIAYVSYNAYPGFFWREMFRDMLLPVLAGVDDPRERVRQAVEFIEQLGKASAANPLAKALFNLELLHLRDSEWWYVYHDDLEPANHAAYFHEFVSRAHEHGLEYLGEADFLEMQRTIYPAATLEKLERFTHGDAVIQDQYLDFVKGRSFRQTLLCRKEAGRPQEPAPGRLTGMYVASHAKSVAETPELAEFAVEEFVGPRGARMRTGDRQVKTAFVRLRESWPGSVRFADLLSAVGGEELPLASALLQAYSAGLLEMHVRPSPFLLVPGKRPQASPLARFQVERTGDVTSLDHKTVRLHDDLDRFLVWLLDGSRTRPALIEALRTFLRKHPVPGSAPVTAASLEERLTRLAAQGLLLA